MKYILITLLVFVVGTLGLNLWQKREFKITKNKLNAELMEANLALGKAQTQFGDASKAIVNLQAEVKDLIEENNEQLTMYGELMAKYKAKGEGKVVYETMIETIELPAELSMKKHHFYWAETERTLQDLGPIFGPTYYRDHRIQMHCLALTDEGGGIAFGLGYQLDFKLEGQLAQTTTDSGAVNHYLTLWELDEENKRIGKFKLRKFDVVVTDVRKPEFYWFAPHLDLGGVVGYGYDGMDGGLTIGFSVSGFGLTKNDLSWRVLRVGMHSGGDKVLFDFAPVLYNLGGPLPLMSNVWVGPYINLNGPAVGGLMFNLVL